MKIPERPPEQLDNLEIWSALVKEAMQDGKPSSRGLSSYLDFIASPAATDQKGRYLHWDEHRFRKPPYEFTIEEHWALLKMGRIAKQQVTPFAASNEQECTFVVTDDIQRNLHEIDSLTRGGLESTRAIPNKQEATRYLVRSLVEEPFNSSLLEGAATTRERAKTLIQKEAIPESIGDRMVLNNYFAMEFIKEQKNEDLTPAIVHELHKIVTQGTLQREEKSGVFRGGADNINVEDEHTGEILHAPPPADELARRMERLCDFANRGNKSDEPFVHPIIKAVILHFMLAYDHPYVDGNGRTARALFYWSVVRDGYWLLEFVSISRIINQAPVSYGKAFLYTETDSFDLTYFLNHQLKVIRESIDQLYAYMNEKMKEIEELTGAIDATSSKFSLNRRQTAILTEAVRSSTKVFTINEHERLSNVSYLTARKDLEGLVELGYLTKRKHGNVSQYLSVKRLARVLGI